MIERTINQVVEMLASSRSILFITGAGISADSGLPTYRDSGGLFNLDTTDDRVPIERVLAGDVMQDDPELAWKYLAQIESACRQARHNRAHEVIAQMERHFERVWTITLNIDGFHRCAGAANVIDLHGDLHHLRCTRCRYRRIVPDYSVLALPPRCPECDAILRPDIVLFGETLPLQKMLMLLLEMDRGFDLVFTIGTSSVFSYVAEPVRMATLLGTPVIEINPSATEVSDLANIRLPLRAAQALDTIWQRYSERYMPAAVPRTPAQTANAITAAVPG